MQTFVRWGPAHLVAIALTVIVPLVLSWWCHKNETTIRTRIIGIGFAILLVGVITAQFLLLNRGSAPRWQEMMPLHVCDLALFACATACVTRNQWIFEIAYFWGLAGTIHGLLTPDLEYAFPAPQFWFFFLGHGGILGSVLFMVAGLHLRPDLRSVFRAYFAILIYGILAGLFNLLFQTNYGYVCEKPGSGSLFDLLGPWPWYIVSSAVVGFVSFWILFVPWALVDKQRNRA